MGRLTICGLTVNGLKPKKNFGTISKNFSQAPAIRRPNGLEAFANAAFKPCRECRAEVSTEAEVCPRCAVQFPTAANPLYPPSSGYHSTAFAVIGVIVIIVLGLLVSGLPEPRPASLAMPQEQSDLIQMIRNTRARYDRRYSDSK